jgi:hypothetical protein
MNRAARLAAAVLPLIGLAGLWWQSQQTYDSGTEWEVPIQGYDPRDFLRGHYVEFTYDWPGIEEFDAPMGPALCLVGKAPALERARLLKQGEPCAHPVRADTSGVYGWDALLRGRLYVDQDRAGVMQRELQKPDQRGIVTIRQREDGSFTPISIRFRPLTAQEKAERDARNAAPPGPPAIMEVSP